MQLKRYILLIMTVSSQQFFAFEQPQMLFSSTQEYYHTGESKTFLDLATERYNDLYKNKLTNDCLPLLVSKASYVDIFYMYCSEQADFVEALPIVSISNIEFPDELTLKIRFWLRVFALWNNHDHIIHSGAYPDVILEIASINQSTSESQESYNQASITIYSHLMAYRKVLQDMHDIQDEKLFSPLMQRISYLMRHIGDGDKYLRAAESLRIQRGQRDYLKQGLELSGRYMPAIKEIFRKVGVPVDLAYLSYIESGFNPQAISKVGAAGIFQLMPKTASYYLTVNEFIDERFDPIKAAYAAAQLLKSNYQQSKNWALAITAYNHGMKGILQAVESVGSENIVDIIKCYDAPNFGFASKNFFAEYLAILTLVESKHRLFPDINHSKSIQFENYVVLNETPVNLLIQKFQITLDDISHLNPDINYQYLQQNGILPAGFIIKLPVGIKPVDPSNPEPLVANLWAGR